MDKEEEETETAEEEETEESSAISNSEAKQLPWVVQMGQDNKALRSELEAIKAAQKEARQKTEIAKALGEEQYQDALKIQQEKAQSEIDAAKSEAESAKAEALKHQMKSAILSVDGIATDGFVKVAMAEYNPETHDSIDNYVLSLKESTDYGQFFTMGKSGVAKRLDGTQGVTVTKGNGTYNRAQLDAMLKSGDSEQMQKAADYNKKHYIEHGSLPQ